MADLMSIDTGAVIIGHGQAELEGAVERRTQRGGDASFHSLVKRMIARISREGACFDQEISCLGVPLHVGGELQGAIVVRCTPEGVADLDRQQDALAAIATLGAAALHTAREEQGLRIKASLFDEAIERDTGIIGESAAMKRLLAMVDRVGPQDTTTLILGKAEREKELIARAIHKKSSRATHPLIAINCAALTESLLESELFVTKKGVFTGAAALKRGSWNWRRGARSFSMKLANSPLRYRRSFSECCRNESSSAWEARRRCHSMCD